MSYSHKKTRKERGLGKYDAPLSFQVEQGRKAFVRGVTVNPYHKDTMQNREWERGFNSAYFERLKKVKEHEARGRG